MNNGATTETTILPIAVAQVSLEVTTGPGSPRSSKNPGTVETAQPER